MLPIVAYGHPILRKVGEEITKDYPDLDILIQNMFDAMYESQGVGLAAPQVNKSIRLFIIDASPYEDEIPEAKGFKKVFINPIIHEESGEEWLFNEGCLSIPNIREDVERKSIIKISYYDENWQYHEEETYDGVLARIIQHEYDHIEGILFVDHLSNMRKMMLRKKLSDIMKGNVRVDYRMLFPRLKKGKR